MPEENGQAPENPLIVIGDKVEPKPYLIALMQDLREENKLLDSERAIKYAVCNDAADVALALKKHLDAVRMILIGPGLAGNAITVARMLSKKAHIVMVIDPRINPLGPDPATYKKVQKNLEDLDVILVPIQEATGEFFEPLVRDYVLSELAAGLDLEAMTPEQRGQMIDKRLDAVTKFPSLPDTQRKVAELSDMDPPKKWAEAIDPDLPTRTVILRLLNSARYGFRSRVESIDQAVALASTKTIREIVTACQIRQIFQKTEEQTIDQFWRHSLAVAFFAKLFSLPADPAEQSSHQKTELERYQLEPPHIEMMNQARLWSRFSLEEGDDPFISGLLHDVGKVTMIMCLEDSLVLIRALIESEVREQQGEGQMWAHSVSDIERFLMKDLDHQSIGGRLAEKWELDPTIQLVISRHHEVQEHSPDLLKLVALANLAGSMLFPYPATEAQHPFPLLVEKIKEGVRKRAGKNLAEDVAAVISEDIFEDLVDVLNRLQIPSHVWEIIDFRTFFQLSYMLAPRIQSAAIGFLQQTGS